MVDRQITITRSGTVTFDARKGRRVRFTVNDSTVATDALIAEPFSPVLNLDAFDGWGGTPPAATYVVPGRLPAGWSISFWADMVRPHEYLSPVEYQFVRVVNGYIPSNPTFASVRSKLASDNVTLRALDPGMTGGVGFQPMTPTSFLPTGLAGQWATPPFSIEFHFTSGYEWQPCAFYDNGGCEIETLGSGLPVFGVHHYAQTFGNAVYGPSDSVGATVFGSQLQAGAYDGTSVFDDPYFTASSQGLPVATHQVWLYQGKKLIAHSAQGSVTVNISSTPRWYTMRMTDSRGAGATIAKSLTLSLSFETQAGHTSSPQSFWPQIIPRGLSGRNAAARGTRTTVPIYFTELGSGNIPFTMSRSGHRTTPARTWRALHVGYGGGHWTVVVQNPSSVGYVLLRVQASNATGETMSETAINAYAVR